MKFVLKGPIKELKGYEKVINCDKQSREIERI